MRALEQGTAAPTFLQALRSAALLLASVELPGSRAAFPKAELVNVARSKLTTCREEWNLDVKRAFGDVMHLLRA